MVNVRERSFLEIRRRPSSRLHDYIIIVDLISEPSREEPGIREPRRNCGKVTKKPISALGSLPKLGGRI